MTYLLRMRRTAWIALLLATSPVLAENTVEDRLRRAFPNVPMIVVRLVDARCDAAGFAGDEAVCTGTMNYIQYPNERRARLAMEVQVGSGQKHFVSFEGYWDRPSAPNAAELLIHSNRVSIRAVSPIRSDLPDRFGATGSCSITQNADISFVRSISCEAIVNGRPYRIRSGPGPARVV